MFHMIQNFCCYRHGALSASGNLKYKDEIRDAILFVKVVFLVLPASKTYNLEII